MLPCRMRKKLERLSSTLGSLLKARGMLARLSEYRILGQWEKTVGPVVASHARPRTVRAGRLYLTVDSPAWMQQLSLLKPEIIEKVNQGLGRQAIKDLALDLGEIGPVGKQARSSRPRGELGPEERGKIEAYLAEVRDPEVKEALRRLIEKDFLRKKEGAR